MKKTVLKNKKAETAPAAAPAIEPAVNLSHDKNCFLSRAFLNTVVCDSPASIKINLNFPSDNEGYGDYAIDIRDCHGKAHLHGEFHEGNMRGTENFFYKTNTIIAHLMAAQAFVAKRMKEVHYSQLNAPVKKKRGVKVQVLDRGGSRTVSLRVGRNTPVCAEELTAPVRYAQAPTI